MMTPVLVGNAIGTRECIPHNLKYSSSDMLHEDDWPELADGQLQGVVDTKYKDKSLADHFQTLGLGRPRQDLELIGVIDRRIDRIRGGRKVDTHSRAVDIAGTPFFAGLSSS